MRLFDLRSSRGEAGSLAGRLRGGEGLDEALPSESPRAVSRNCRSLICDFAHGNRSVAGGSSDTEAAAIRTHPGFWRVPQFPTLEIIHSWPAVLVQIAVVVLIGAIRRSPGWSQRFLKAFFLGIPAYAWAGLGVWAFMLPWAILCHAYAPRQAREIAELVANHPLLGLAVGPILAVAFLVAGEYRGTPRSR